MPSLPGVRAFWEVGPATFISKMHVVLSVMHARQRLLCRQRGHLPDLWLYLHAATGRPARTCTMHTRQMCSHRLVALNVAARLFRWRLDDGWTYMLRRLRIALLCMRSPHFFRGSSLVSSACSGAQRSGTPARSTHGSHWSSSWLGWIHVDLRSREVRSHGSTVQPNVAPGHVRDALPG